MREKLEDRIAASTEAGRETLRVWRSVQRNMTGAQRLRKAIEITDHVRSLMRAGLKAQHPELNEAELNELYVDRLLSFHGLSLAELRRKQAEESGDNPQGATCGYR